MDGEPNGKGKYTYNHDECLECHFVEGKASGQGQFVKKDGFKYNGNLKNNK